MVWELGVPEDIEGVEWYSLEEVETLAGVPHMTLYRWRRNRLVPAGHRRPNNRVYFTRPEIDAIRAYKTTTVPAEVGRPRRERELEDRASPRQVEGLD